MSRRQYALLVICPIGNMHSTPKNILRNIFCSSPIVLVILFGWLLSAHAQPPIEAPQTSKTIDFQTDVAPILDQHCSQCHGPAKQTADLRLDLRSAILKGSSSGPILQVGQSSKSRLIEVVSGQDPDYQMPPEGEKLSDSQIQVLKLWIDQGALGPDDAKLLEKPLPGVSIQSPMLGLMFRRRRIHQPPSHRSMRHHQH